jgi:EmrB/QacA subfamily drug resistance transporter
MAASLSGATHAPGGISLASVRGRWVLVTAVLGSAIAGIDSAVMNVALPTIGRDLKASFSQLQWTVTAYTLSLAALILLSGALSDHFGRRRVFLTGVVGFTAASLLCAVAPGMDALIGARSIQGIGGALMIPASLAIIQSSFRAEDRPRAIGIWSGFTGVASVIAPLAGGWLLGLGTWRWIFVINVPVAAVLVLIAVRHVPESRDAVPAPMDWPGSFLAVVALTAVTYVLTAMPGSRSASALSVAATVIALGASAVFVWHERRSAAPMLPAAMFRSAPFVTANLVTFFVYGAFGAFSMIFTVALETISGYSPVKTGSTLLPVTILALLLSGPSGQLSARIGPRLQMTAGPLLCAAAALLAVRVSAHTGYWTTVIPLECVFGLGIAATVAPLASTALSSVPTDHAGVASAANNAVARVAALLWIAALPPVAGLSGSAYANATALRGGYQEICVICAASLTLAGALAALTLRNCHPCGGMETIMDMRTEDAQTAAADRLAIRELVDAYARHADRRQPAEQAALYSENGRTLVYTDPAATEATQVLTGRAEHAEVFRSLNQYTVTTHFNGQSTITLDGDRATGESYCLAHHLLAGEHGRSLILMSIRYRDRFTKDEGAWYFAERKLIIDWTDTRPSKP